MGELTGLDAQVEGLKNDSEHDCLAGVEAQIAVLRQNYSVLSEKYVELLAEKKCLELDIREARMLATKQADDWGLWFVATAAPEQYLQDALRELHLAVASCG